MAERVKKRPCGPGEHGQRIEWRKWKQQKKEEKKKWKDLKLMKKLERQRAQEEEAKRQQEEEAGAQREDQGRPYTLSVALPGSILDNAQSPELRTYLAGQIARACTIFCVDEIVVFDEEGQDAKTVEGEFRGVGKKGQACVQLARILQYLECPQYLRKAFFPKHQDLQFAGLLNPLDSPHHMRQDEESEFREGIVVDRPTRPGHGSFVNCGMKKEVKIDKNLEPGLRVTVQLNQKQLPGAVFAEAPFQDGYDLTIGTSERGSDVASAQLPSFRHALVVFGGLQGLEAGVDADPNLEVAEPSVLFDLYVNTCPSQGSRTIRTEVSPPLRLQPQAVVEPLPPTGGVSNRSAALGVVHSAEAVSSPCALGFPQHLSGWGVKNPGRWCPSSCFQAG
uniref:28S rRNA (uridine-N(3))-methyltransferase n=1 Tax=Suricata suricatta TaxID=37032 RepID=A0A673TH11_SURSU